MFDLGNGDKEKLEENMEEIKQLVNEGKDVDKDQNTEGLEGLDEDFNPDIDAEDSFQPENTAEEPRDQPNSNFNQENSLQSNNNLEDTGEAFNPENGQEEFNQEAQDMPDQEELRQTDELDEEFEEMREELQNEISSIKDTQESHDRLRQHTEDNTSQEKAEESQQVKSKSLGMNEERDEGREEPLFLEVENFEDMKQMVEEMHYLTTEMDDVMNHLEAGIEEDQETVTEAKEIVNEFEERRGKIQKTLKNN